MPKISSDGLTYTIKIKKNIRYQLDETRYVVAQDFINQIKRLVFKPLKSNGNWLFEGKIKGIDQFSKKVGNDFDKMLATPIEGLKAIDEHTLQISLIRPEPNLVYFLCMPFTSPIPKDLLIKYNNDLSKVLIGTGPYQLKRFDDTVISFEESPHFRDEFYPSVGDRYANTEDLLVSSSQRLPFIKTINFHVIPEEDDQWIALKKGDVDILSVPKSKLSRLSDKDSDISKLIRSKIIHLKHFSKLSSRWLAFNMSDPILGKNLDLRKAIAHAIDYDKYIELISSNTNLRANSLINPSIPGYKPTQKMSYDYNLSKAKQFLAKSKIDPQELKLTYSTRGKTQTHYAEALFFKKSLKKLGIDLEIQYLDFASFLKRGREGELQFFTDSWIFDYPDAENILQLLISKSTPGLNKSVYKNPVLDQLYNRLAKTLNPLDRFKIIQEFEDVVDKEIPWILLMFESSYILYSSRIQNFRKSFFIRNHFKYLKLI
jgi:ABC-type transport system substrate-binding protein